MPPATLSLALLQITFVLWHFPQHWVRAERLGNSGSCREPRFDSLLRVWAGRVEKSRENVWGPDCKCPPSPVQGDDSTVKQTGLQSRQGAMWDQISKGRVPQARLLSPCTKRRE